MAVKVDIRKDLKGVIPRVNQMTQRGQYVFVNQVHSDMNPYVPARSYDLRNQSSVSLDYKSVIYNVPYAKPLFYNQYRNYTTPGTGPRWDLKASAIHMRSWERVVKRAMK